VSEVLYDKNTDYSNLMGEVAAPDGAGEGGFMPLHRDAAGNVIPYTALMEVVDFSIDDLRKEFKGWQSTKDQTCIAANLKVTLRCVSGEHEGCTITDFLPMPYKGLVLLKEVANKWVNFAKAIGLALPTKTGPGGTPVISGLLPPGFKPQDIMYRKCNVRIVAQKNGKLDSQGEPYPCPAMMGYSIIGTNAHASPVNAASQPSAPVNRPAAIPSEPAAPVGTAASNLDDL
jgi:hypothetical protein